MPSPTRPSTVLFLVDLHIPPSGDSLAPARRVELVTELDRVWLGKPLREALIVPALSSEEAGGSGKTSDEALAAQADQCSVEVEGVKLIDLMVPADTFAKPYGSSVSVSIELPHGC